MNTHARLCLVLATLWPLSHAHAAAPPTGRTPVEKALDFLRRDAVTWRKDRACSTCHHGTLTVWALSEAKSRGYHVAPEEMADVLKWTKGRLLGRIDLPRDKRPGWSMVNTPALYLSVLALSVPGQDTVTAADLKSIAGHLLRHQEADGSWAWSSAPAKNRPPPFFESDEVATLLGYLSLGPRVPADPKAKSPERDSREKAAAWLAKAKPTDTTQSLALRVLVRAKDGGPPAALEKGVGLLLARQNKDGGWGQLKDTSSDAYATGQTLYLLSVAGVTRDRAEVRRGVAFLLATQKPDGSWPMKPRSHPGATPAGNVVPITYFGSAWATLALLRCTPG